MPGGRRPPLAWATRFDWVRRVHDPQVLLEGSGSFLSDASEGPAPDAGRPQRAEESESFLPAGVVEVAGRRWFAVVDGRGRVALQFTEWPDPAWAGWHALVLTSHCAPAEHLAWLREQGIPYLVIGQQRVDLPAALRLLGDRLGVRTVVCTGGGRLGGALLRAGLVDEIDLDVLPVAIGGRGTPALFDERHPWARTSGRPGSSCLNADTLPGGRVRLRYNVQRQEPGPPTD